MKYAGRFCPSLARRLSKAGVAGMRFYRWTGALALIVCFGAPAAFADATTVNDLPGAIVSGYMQDALTQDGGPLTSITGSGAYNFNDYFTSNGGGTWAEDLCPGNSNCLFDSVSDRAQVQMTPFPSLSMSMSQLSSIPNGGGGTQGFATLSYNIEIKGPSPYAWLDVSGWALANGPQQGAQAWVNISGAPVASYGDQSGGGIPVYFSALLWEPTDAPIEVVLNVDGTVNNGMPFDSPAPTATFYSTNAYVDPYFSIDPSNADPGAYSILVSPGVGNAASTGIPGTPEPSTWAMMLLGFAGLGWVGYRGRIAARTMAARA